MPDIPQNRCYVYLNKKNTCEVCHSPLTHKSYSVSTKKGNLIDNQGKYCVICNAFVIKYGTYLANKKNWTVLNSNELQKVANEYADRHQVKHPYTKKSGVADNSAKNVFYYVSGLSKTRQEERISRNKAAKGKKIREEREKEKREQIKKRLELKEEQRIKQLQ